MKKKKSVYKYGQNQMNTLTVSKSLSRSSEDVFNKNVNIVLSYFLSVLTYSY